MTHQQLQAVAPPGPPLPGQLPEMPAENIYGHFGRVEWMRRFLRPDDHVVEVGCGTGWMVTLPLRRWGLNATGLDIDEQSIAYGRRLYRASGLDEDALCAGDFRELEGPFDAVIISEVLEHLTDEEGLGLLGTAREKLRPGGTLLVTVPNGRGWYELESFLWTRTGLGRLLRRAGIPFLLRRIRAPFVSGRTFDKIPSTLSKSPHIQRFSFETIRGRIEAAGFEVIAARGSVLFCGPFSDMLLTGSRLAHRLDFWLGERFSTRAAGFFVAARRPVAVIPATPESE